MTLDALTAALADRYRIERELGQGGMATVYLAEDLRHTRKVAIKVLREDLAASLGAARFLREIQIAAQLQHPNILPLLDSGEAGGFLYYVMPYVPGQSLRERLAREGELPVHDAVRLLVEVTDALAHAHQMGVVHRDIKPDNVMMSGRHALVTDFGVAKAVSEATGRNTITTLGVALGTPAYMSPEQAAADPHVDHRTDIYAVGVMAYELLTGRPPFTGATPQQVLAAHVTEAPEPVAKRRAAISAPLEQVVMRCLAKRPADRYQSADELLQALEAQATPSTGITPAQTRPVPAVKSGPRRWLVPAIAVTAVLAVALVWLLGRGDAPVEAATVQRTQVTRTGTAEFAASPSPDGQRLAYAERRCDDAYICTYDLVVQDIGGPGSSRIIEGMQAIYGIDWSGNGRNLVVLGILGGGESAFFLVPALGGAAPQILGASPVQPFGDGDSVMVGSMPTPGRLVLRSTTLQQPSRGDSIVIERPGLRVFEWRPSPGGRWVVVTPNIGDEDRLIILDRKAAPRDSVDLPRYRVGGFPDDDRFVAGQADPNDPSLLTLVEYRLESNGKLRKSPRLVASQVPPGSIGITRGGLAYLAGTLRTSIVALDRGRGGSAAATMRTVATTTGVLSSLMSSDGAYVILQRQDPADPNQIRESIQPFEGGEERPIGNATTGPQSIRSRTVDGKGLVVLDLEGTAWRITEIDLATNRRTDRGTFPDSGGGAALEAMGDGSLIMVPRNRQSNLRIRSRSGEIREVRTPDVMTQNMEDSPYGDGFVGWGFSAPNGDSLVLYHVPPGAREGRSLARIVFDYINGMHWLPGGIVEMVIGETPSTSAFYRLDVATGRLERQGTIPLNFIVAASFSNAGDRLSLRTVVPTLDAWVMRWQ